MKVTNQFSSRESYLTKEDKEGEEEGSHFVHGTAISANDILKSMVGFGSLVHLRFTRNALINAAKTLEGKELVLDHVNNKVDATVGTVVESKYEDGDILYKAKIIEEGHEGLLAKIKAGILETSIRAFHQPISQLNHDEKKNVYEIDETEFDNLSIVNRGEATSADINYGDTQLSQTKMFKSLNNDEDLEVIAASQSLPTQDNTMEVFHSNRVELADSYSVHTPSYEGTSTGKLSEGDIPNDDYESHYIVLGDSKSDSGFPVVDANNTLRKGNVESAWKMRNQGKGDGEKIGRVVKKLADEWDDLDFEDDSESENSQVDDPNRGNMGENADLEVTDEVRPDDGSENVEAKQSPKRTVKTTK